MRQIKFRGLTENKNWIYGMPINYKNEDFSILHNPFDYYGCEATNICNRIKVIKNTVGQFIGLKDKNKVDIYEGDILTVNGSTLVKIEFSFGQFVGRKIDKNDPYPEVQNRNWLQWEIIGNIHENPELLNFKTR